MKIFLIFFGIFFSIFFLIGYKNGYDAVHGPLALTHQIFDHVKIIPYEKTCLLAYGNSKNDLYCFDADKDSLITINYAAERNRFNYSSTNKNILASFSNTAYAFAGAGTLGFAAKDLFTSEFVEELKSKKGMAKYAGIVVGLAAGSYIGDYCGERFGMPSETSPEFVSTITSDSMWTARKAYIYYKINNDLKDKASTIKDSSIKQALVDILDSAFATVFDRSFHLKLNSLHSKQFIELMKLQTQIERRAPNTTGGFIHWLVIIVLVLAPIAAIAGIVYLSSSTYEFFGGLVVSGKTSKIQKAFVKEGAPKTIEEAVRKLQSIVPEQVKRDAVKLSERDFLDKYALKRTRDPVAIFLSNGFFFHWNLQAYYDTGKKDVDPTFVDYLKSIDINKSGEFYRIIYSVLFESIKDGSLDIDQLILKVRQTKPEPDGKDYL